MPSAVALAAIVVVLLLLLWVWPSGAGAANFTPVPISTCGPPRDADQFVIDMTDRTGTVVRDPYPPPPGLTREGYAGRSDGRYLGETASQGRAPEPAQEADERAMSLMAAVARRSPPTVAGPRSSRALLGDIDTDFVTDGIYSPNVMKEALTSRRIPRANPLTASKVGLGSTRMDPRFEPGAPERLCGGDVSQAPGGHAGGPSLGAYDSSRFQNKGGWGSNYVFGFGDVGSDGPEALVTGESRW